MPKEIEVKLVATAEVFQRVLAQLAATPQKADEKQLDVYFSPDKGFIHEKVPFEWLSIRSRGGKNKVCYKHFYPEGAEKTTHCEECEFLIDNPVAQAELFKHLGFKPVITVDKHRLAYQFMETEVALDTVKDLGYFIEIEANEREDLTRGQAQIDAVIQALNLEGLPQDLRGYPYRLIEKLKAA